jgi:hypothetical protein
MSLLTRIQPRPRPDIRHRNADRQDGEMMVSLALTPEVRREIDAEARTAASAGWTPTALQPEPAYLQVIDHQAAAAAHAVVQAHHHTLTDPLSTMRIWLRAIPITAPAPGSHGPAARDQADAAHQYALLTDAADRALTVYEQNRHALAAELGRIDHYRHTARHTFTTTLAAHHHTPDRLTTNHPTPGQAVTAADLPDHPDAAETRNRLHNLRPHLSAGDTP